MMLVADWIVVGGAIALVLFTAWRIIPPKHGPVRSPPYTLPRSAFKVENPCPRCGRENIKSANFCRACGLMLQSHNTVSLWLMEQREMMELRQKLSVHPPTLRPGEIICINTSTPPVALTITGE